MVGSISKRVLSCCRRATGGYRREWKLASLYPGETASRWKQRCLRWTGFRFSSRTSRLPSTFSPENTGPHQTTEKNIGARTTDTLGGRVTRLTTRAADHLESEASVGSSREPSGCAREEHAEPRPNSPHGAGTADILWWPGSGGERQSAGTSLVCLDAMENAAMWSRRCRDHRKMACLLSACSVLSLVTLDQPISRSIRGCRLGAVRWRGRRLSSARLAGGTRVDSWSEGSWKWVNGRSSSDPRETPAPRDESSEHGRALASVTDGRCSSAPVCGSEK